MTLLDESQAMIVVVLRSNIYEVVQARSVYKGVFFTLRDLSEEYARSTRAGHEDI